MRSRFVLPKVSRRMGTFAQTKSGTSIEQKIGMVLTTPIELNLS
ncbi:hypothetical protein NIES2104_19410 [Leptolyngbya sp. NIES-2104]|nr:hypothetical protein NIES2104_19410 [Leptolyngbya sp. NIES-2104]